MKPTEILMQEHRVIEQVLTCLERMAEICKRGEPLCADDARDAIAFLKAFADRCHHGKEEAQLFPLLEERGLPSEGGPTQVMRQEHEIGRAHIRAMNEAVTAVEQGDANGASEFIRHADEYVALLREHIQKEDHCLFAMADSLLSQADQAALLARFEHVEQHDMGPGTHERYVEIADRLADCYHVPRVNISGSGHGCCGHGK